MNVKVTWETKWEALRESHRAEIRHWRSEIFVADATDDYHERFEWEPSAAGVVVVYCDDHVASFLKIVDRTITLDDLNVPVGGVSGLMTVPEYRNRGSAAQHYPKPSA